jgi:hypothetical protein
MVPPVRQSRIVAATAAAVFGFGTDLREQRCQRRLVCQVEVEPGALVGDAERHLPCADAHPIRPTAGLPTG